MHVFLARKGSRRYSNVRIIKSYDELFYVEYNNLLREKMVRPRANVS